MSQGSGATIKTMATVRKTKKEVGWFHRNYAAFMPQRKLYRVVVWVLATTTCLSVVVQLLYPPHRGLPLAKVANQSLALASHEEMAQVIVEHFDRTKLRLTVGDDKIAEFSLKSAGAEPNTEVMIEYLSDYPLWQRLIPGSLLWWPRHLLTADVHYANKPFQEFVKGLGKELSFVPQNARLAIKNGALEATEAMSGSQVDSNELLKSISSAFIRLGETTTMEVPSKRTPAERSSKDLSDIRKAAESALAHTIVINADDKKFSPDKIQLASWIIIGTDNQGNVALAVDKEKIKSYLTAVNAEVETPAGQTNITVVDGQETGRVTGVTGRSIAVDAAAEHIANSLLSPPQLIVVAVQFVEVQPSVIFNNKYTATQAGLQAYVNDIARTKNMYIMIQQLDGNGWSVGARANVSIPSGSTYKLFVALVLFDKIDKGEIHWEDPMLDTTVAGCFERMTVASTNPCAEKWIAEFGRQYINDFIYVRGFSTGTSFTTGSANQTTAADLNKFMTGLNDGTLVAGAHRDRLLDSLGRHPYRGGIPKGSKGAVHDKVGFLWDYIHDTAIVNHPNGNYIMTIMTKGQSYAAIASVTREIERIMYP